MWRPYPEEIRETPLGGLDLLVFRPDHHQVVMGAGGKQEKEVYADQLETRGIPLYKRKGGGGTVLLGPETIVVTVHAGVIHPFQNLAYFEAINRALIDVFRTWAPLDFKQRGISDVALHDRKLVGSSIYRRRQYLLFQASILVSLNLPLMNEVLRHPPKEPDYRQNRDHGSFLSCLREVGVERSFTELMLDLRLGLLPRIRENLDAVDGAKGLAG